MPEYGQYSSEMDRVDDAEPVESTVIRDKSGRPIGVNNIRVKKKSSKGEISSNNLKDWDANRGKGKTSSLKAKAKLGHRDIMKSPIGKYSIERDHRAQKLRGHSAQTNYLAARHALLSLMAQTGRIAKSYIGKYFIKSVERSATVNGIKYTSPTIGKYTNPTIEKSLDVVLNSKTQHQNPLLNKKIVLSDKMFRLANSMAVRGLLRQSGIASEIHELTATANGKRYIASNRGYKLKGFERTAIANGITYRSPVAGAKFTPGPKMMQGLLRQSGITSGVHERTATVSGKRYIASNRGYKLKGFERTAIANGITYRSPVAGAKFTLGPKMTRGLLRQSGVALWIHERTATVNGKNYTAKLNAPYSLPDPKVVQGLFPSVRTENISKLEQKDTNLSPDLNQSSSPVSTSALEHS